MGSATFSAFKRSLQGAVQSYSIQIFNSIQTILLLRNHNQDFNNRTHTHAYK